MDILKLLELIVKMLTLLLRSEKIKIDNNLKRELKNHYDIISQENDPELHFTYGISFLVLNDHALAKEAFNKAIECREKETRPSWARYHYYQLLTYLEQIKELKIRESEEDIRSICEEIQKLRNEKLKELEKIDKDYAQELEGLSYIVEMIGWRRICNDKAKECRNEAEKCIKTDKIKEFYDSYKCE